ncbi:MAG TPA: hypothetical protein VL002_06480 [Candidimonas sp.]|nr:hypothetical protein [Candidimonas sp.]
MASSKEFLRSFCAPRQPGLLEPWAGYWRRSLGLGSGGGVCQGSQYAMSCIVTLASITGLANSVPVIANVTQKGQAPARARDVPIPTYCSVAGPGGRCCSDFRGARHRGRAGRRRKEPEGADEPGHAWFGAEGRRNQGHEERNTVPQDLTRGLRRHTIMANDASARQSYANKAVHLAAVA